MAFMLSGGGCMPGWDSTRPLLGGVDQPRSTRSARAAATWRSPSAAGAATSSARTAPRPAALAGAYQQVINAYNLKYIDIDIENNDEFENFTVQDRILGAMRIVKQNNPGIKTIITFGTATTGPSATGIRLINRAAALREHRRVHDHAVRLQLPGATCSPAPSARPTDCATLKNAFGWTDAQAYAHMGISGMNGVSDVE